MRIIFILIFSIIITYSCAPINKQHGYLIEDVISSSDEMLQFSLGESNENDVYLALGSPSIEISDINNVWIYLISMKRENVFESDQILYQSIFRFEFDENGLLISKDFMNESDFTEIAFSTEKTRVITDTYGITDQIYQSFTRGQ